ncbi:hypothetical protein KAU93_03570, partial [Candidatus Bathyarchaeota archaeon]|nr:hypothetical protein [Candidatus Bathyarchaeota archaeon]
LPCTSSPFTLKVSVLSTDSAGKSLPVLEKNYRQVRVVFVFSRETSKQRLLLSLLRLRLRSMHASRQLERIEKNRATRHKGKLNYKDNQLAKKDGERFA